MFRYIKENGFEVLDIPELKNLRKRQFTYTRSSKSYYHKKKLLDSVRAFFDWYISYCNKELGNKDYSEKLLTESVLRENFKSDKQFKEYLFKCLFISREYVKNLNGKVAIKNINAFTHTLLSLEIELEWLIANYEVYYKKSSQNLSLQSGMRKLLSPTDIYSAAKSLFYIEEAKKIDDLYLRDLKPNVIFQIRQLIEVFGRQLIGYYSIEDQNGNPIKKFTQVSWDFIKEEVKKPNSNIQFPFDIHMILQINKWSNGFVHTTFIHSSYIQFFVLKAISILFKSNSSGIKIYTGKTVSKFNCADIKISNYNSLKNDFESFLALRMPNISVNWMDPKDVTAYIISL
ncbi:MAG: hypothetical protein ABJH05_05910 [Fulvivirga sp.]